MHIKISKTTKNSAVRKETVSDSKISFGAGHSDDFWWNIIFSGKDKNGLSVSIDIQMSEKEREKFIKEFEEKVVNWKKYIKEKS